ncbi:MAG: AgmX/PglI C-terminal domain-containing protein [Spongiibacteraceae bacterium]
MVEGRGSELVLPWSSSAQEDTTFSKILGVLFILFLVLAVIIPLIPVAEITREQKEALPPQLARVILEEKQLPKPEPIKPKPVEKKKEVIKEKIKEPQVKPKPKPQPVDLVRQAKETAAVSGLLAFQDDLADMRDSVDIASLSKNNLSRGEAEAAKVERSIITSKATATSGGIQTAALSRDTGGSALSGKQDTKVSSSLDQQAKKQGVNSESVAAGGRSDESIRRTMDANKGAIFSIYNRALRTDPGLQGKFVFEILIAANGSVIDVKLLSSELNNGELDGKILSRIKLIRFPAQDVINTRVNYQFDFLPY